MDERELEIRNLKILLDESIPYDERLDAYDFLYQGCEDIVDDMLEEYRKLEKNDTSKMLIEILANYPGRDEIYLALVSWLYTGQDVALFARLIGKYGDKRGIEVLRGFLKEYEPVYIEYAEIQTAIEILGGEWTDEITDLEHDELYKLSRGSIEEDEDMNAIIIQSLRKPPEK